MANIQFSALVTSMTGKLNGSVIQKSVNGFVIKNKNNGSTGSSQIVYKARSNFFNIVKMWATLTNEERQSWYNQVYLGVKDFQLFVKLNCIRPILGEDPVRSFVADPAPTLVANPQ